MSASSEPQVDEGIVTVIDPDDSPDSMPVYDGPAAGAASLLIPGLYPATLALGDEIVSGCLHVTDEDSFFVPDPADAP